MGLMLQQTDRGQARQAVAFRMPETIAPRSWNDEENLRTCSLGEIEIASLHCVTAGTLVPVAFDPSPHLLLVLSLKAPANPLQEVRGDLLLKGKSGGHAVAFYDLAQGWAGLFQAPFAALHLRIPKTSLSRQTAATAAGDPEAEAGLLQGPLLCHLGSALNTIVEQSAASDGSAPGVAEGLASALLAHLRALPSLGCAAPPDLARGGLAPWQVRRAKTLIVEQLEENRPLSKVAQACGLSSGHFAKAFKQSVGVTPRDWRSLQRVERAKALLRESGLPLARVSAACGYADQSHFTRCFASVVGETPARWRRLRRTGPQQPSAEESPTLHP